MSEKTIFGTNRSGSFAVYGGKLYAPAANGIVITRCDGTESTFWQPTTGAYAVEHVAISVNGTLCFCERRLNLVLHVYNATSLQRVHEVSDVGRVALRSVAFDESGERLFVFGTTPTCEVKVYNTSAYGGLSLSQVVAVPNRLSDATLTPTKDGFILSNSTGLVGFAPQSDGQPVECLELDTSRDGSGILAVAVGGSKGEDIIYATTAGTVCIYRTSERAQASKVIYDLQDSSDAKDNSPVSAVCAQAGDPTIIIAQKSGTVTQISLEGDTAGSTAVKLGKLPFSPLLIVPGDESLTTYVAQTTGGFYKMDVPLDGSGAVDPVVIRSFFQSDVVKCHTTADRKHVVVLYKDGSFLTADMKSDVKYFHHHHTVPKGGNVEADRDPDSVLDSCMVQDLLVIVHGHDHRATIHDPQTGKFMGALPYGNPEAKPTKCVSNPAGFLIIFDERCVFFYRPMCRDAADTVSSAQKDELPLVPCGFFVADPLVMMSSVISTACGLPGPHKKADNDNDPGRDATSERRSLSEEEGRFLVACSNGEVYLVSTPLDGYESSRREGMISTTASPGAVEHPVERVLLGMWRVDFPLQALYPCYVDADVVNVLVHSLDKDTKLYAFDRRQGKDPKGAPVRPYFLMRDHDSGGRCFDMLPNGTTLCSAGKDGRLVLRDMSPYQKKLTPIPPSKEKRKPLGEATVWHFADGGITSIAVASGDKVVCLGGGGQRSGSSSSSDLSASVVKVVRAPIAKKTSANDRSWKEPTWQLVRAEGTAPEEESPDVNTKVHGADFAASPEEALAIREGLEREVNNLQAEWTEQMKLLDSVEVAVDDLLLEKEKNEFQEACADAIFEMRNDEYYGQLENQYLQEVIKDRCVATMEVPLTKISSVVAPDLEVYNFNVAKQVRPRLRVAKKLAFLRTLQKRASSSSDSECGFSFQQQHNPLRVVDGDVASGTASVNGETITTLRNALYPSCDVYTCGRSCLQAGLLRGLTVALKEAFNQEFTLLRQKKQSALALLNERTQRCVQILKQLGEVTRASSDDGSIGATNAEALSALFATRVDPDEDPDRLYTVHDSELDAAVRALIPQKQGATIYSPENEAALKLWMDGLEKDVEVVRVTLAVPEFADDTKDTFVPLDERTDEQVRLYEEYEKKLKEETEAVEARKDALRNELRSLQKLNRVSAEEIDAGLARLRSRRIATAERIGEAELQVIQLTHQYLKVEDAFRRFVAVEKDKKELMKTVQHLDVALEVKQNGVASSLAAVDHSEEEIRQYMAEVIEMSPFDDEAHGEKLLRRFGRWRRKFEDGKAELPNAAKHPEDCPVELWEEFCEHCESLLSLQEKTTQAAEHHQGQEAALQQLEEERVQLLHRSEEAEAQQQRVGADVFLDVAFPTTCQRLPPPAPSGY